MARTKSYLYWLVAWRGSTRFRTRSEVLISVAGRYNVAQLRSTNYKGTHKYGSQCIDRFYNPEADIHSSQTKSIAYAIIKYFIYTITSRNTNMSIKDYITVKQETRRTSVLTRMRLVCRGTKWAWGHRLRGPEYILDTTEAAWSFHVRLESITRPSLTTEPTYGSGSHFRKMQRKVWFLWIIRSMPIRSKSEKDCGWFHWVKR